MPSPRSLCSLRSLLLLPLAWLLAGCNTVVMNASGDVAQQQGRLIVIATVLMLLIIVPVIALTLLFAWRYRHANTDATYKPDWDHSTSLELVIWAAPLMIIIALGAVTWIYTHTLDPYRPLTRIDARHNVGKDVHPLVVEVVALDWKWLFIYPELGIASVNELAAPIDVPINFKITSTTVMNSFFVPALAGQIYAMPGMQTSLSAVMNKPGEYTGFSANYSGAGFSDMRFKFYGMTSADFERWVQTTRAGGDPLSREAYLELAKPSMVVAAKRYGGVAPGLFDLVVNRCADGKKMCAAQMMAIDAGGLGSTAAYKVASLDAHKYVEALACTPDNPEGKPVLPAGAGAGAVAAAKN